MADPINPTCVANVIGRTLSFCYEYLDPETAGSCSYTLRDLTSCPEALRNKALEMALENCKEPLFAGSSISCAQVEPSDAFALAPGGNSGFARG